MWQPWRTLFSLRHEGHQRLPQRLGLLGHRRDLACVVVRFVGGEALLDVRAAVGVPSRACIRRKQAPRALWAWCTLRAASRRATVTRGAPGRTRRDSTVPPEIVCGGHRPSQLQTCCTRGHRGMSVPISLRRTTAVPSAIPSMVVTSTPAM